MESLHAQERTGLFFVLTPLTLAVTVALIAIRSELLVSWWTIAAIGAPWIAFSIFLRLHRETWGREGAWVDLWAISHAIGGALLGLFGIGFVWVAAIVVWWELVELACRVHETPQNRAMDIVLALAAWATAQLVTSGGLVGV